MDVLAKQGHRKGNGIEVILLPFWEDRRCLVYYGEFELAN